MIHIELTREEAQLLHGVLDSCLSDLRGEIMETDEHDYRLMLKRREVLLKDIIQHLEAEGVKVAYE